MYKIKNGKMIKVEKANIGATVGPSQVETVWAAFEKKHNIEELTSERYEAIRDEAGDLLYTKMQEMFGEPEEGYSYDQEMAAEAELRNCGLWLEIYDDMYALPRVL
jgi:hypothetical protein